jgi:dTDP-4-dehydrorhamnose reductase
MSDGSESCYLIVGSESLIGDQLRRELLHRNHHVAGTSRRSDRQPDLHLLDLGRLDPGAPLSADLRAFVVRQRPVVVFLAGVTRFQQCEQDRTGTFVINVTNSLAVLRSVLAAGCFTIFVSSSAVFSGLRPFPTEVDATDPTTEYGRQKATVESILTNFALKTGNTDRLAIVRPTKVLPDRDGLVANWVLALRGGENIGPFHDLILSPVSVSFVVRGLVRLSSERRAGVFHFSGVEDVSYAMFAYRLAETLGAPVGLIEPVAAPRHDPNDPFPRFASLAMSETSLRIGLQPQQLTQTISDVLTKDLTAGVTY